MSSQYLNECIPRFAVEFCLLEIAGSLKNIRESVTRLIVTRYYFGDYTQFGETQLTPAYDPSEEPVPFSGVLYKPLCLEARVCTEIYLMSLNAHTTVNIFPIGVSLAFL